MSRLPRAIDELMWEIAEADSPDAVEEFGNRYPEYRSELVKRLYAVRGLKGAKPLASPRRFEPKQHMTSHPLPQNTRWATVGVVALLAVTLVFAGLTVAKVTENLNKKPAQSVVQNEPPAIPYVTPMQPVPEGSKPPVNHPEDKPAIPPDSVPPATAEDRFERLVTLNEPKVHLHDALNKLGKQAGLRLVLAPGLPNPLVVIQYDNARASVVLKDMGQNFGFTALPQDDKTALIVPAVERNAKPEAPGTGDFTGPGLKPLSPTAKPGKTIPGPMNDTNGPVRHTGR